MAVRRTWVSVTLAGAPIDVRCGPGTERLVDAFLPGDDPGDATAGTVPLTLTMRVDGDHLDGQVSGDEDGSQHRRSGEVHAWVVPRPRHLQRFTPGAAPHAELVVDATSREDGTVRSRPAVHAIAAWAAGRGIMPIHAAAVARDGRALLLVGAGGRGKTTTALTLATRGWQLIADDVCFLEHTPAGPVVHGLYGTAVLTLPMAERLGAAAWEGLGRTHVGKVAFRLPPDLPVARSAALHAVVAVAHTVGDPYRATDLPRRAAHAAWQETFAPALQTHGPTADWLAAYARAARTLPVSHLTLGWDAQRLDDVLAGMLDAAGGRAW
jgi:hypothetical protein